MMWSGCWPYCPRGRPAGWNCATKEEFEVGSGNDFAGPSRKWTQLRREYCFESCLVVAGWQMKDRWEDLACVVVVVGAAAAVGAAVGVVDDRVGLGVAVGVDVAVAVAAGVDVVVVARVVGDRPVGCQEFVAWLILGRSFDC